MIVLIGFMGAGKSTVGRKLAAQLGLPFVDTDETIERSEGRSVATIFDEDGEARFRSLERETVAAVLEGGDAVVSLGGGAVTDPLTCGALGWHTVVHLDVEYQDAMRRIGHDPGRPLLHLSDPKALFEERRPVYQRLATLTISTTGLSPDEITERILEETQAAGDVSQAPPIVVELGDRSYPVLVGADLTGNAAELFDLEGVGSAFIVTHAHLAAAAKPLIDSLASRGVVVNVATVAEGETSKRLEVAERLYGEMAGFGINRSGLVVGFGGGVVCDLAGFVASTYHRGMRVLHIPSTLLAQVDAAIGGKTGVNLSLGKNLVGTIHQPIGVLCDVALLRTLSDEDMRSGLAEVIKYGLISEPSLLQMVVDEQAAVQARDEGLLEKIVRRSAAIKASVVAGDEREAGRREILNYGHTFGHAIEHLTGMRHGEAIAVGMMAAAHLAAELGMLERAAVDQHRAPLVASGLPVEARLDVDETLEVLKRDKKNRGNVRFVLLDAIGSPRTGIGAPDELVRSALRSVAR